MCHMEENHRHSPKTVTGNRNFHSRLAFFGSVWYKTYVKGTERNESNGSPESGLDNFDNNGNASHDAFEYLETTFTIECVDPSFDATNEILQQFESGEDTEFDTIVPI